LTKSKEDYFIRIIGERCLFGRSDERIGGKKFGLTKEPRHGTIALCIRAKCRFKILAELPRREPLPGEIEDN
jgi:hypothetical protein